MLGRVLVVCVALFLPFVYSAVLPEEVEATPYFIHPKDRKPGVLTPRIIGGEEVTPHSYPFQAALVIYKGTNVYFCGGTLLTNQWILTAAHCVDMKPDYILVGLGEHDLINIDIDTAVIMNATKYVAHTGWNETTFQNDVAVIRLPKNVTFTEYIQPVEIAKGTDKYNGQKASLIGWGQTETESLSSVLKRVNSTVMTNDDCSNVNSVYKQVIKPMHICTSGVGTIGVCSGDSGGPLIVDGVQVGITSFGTTDCQLGMPSVFTRITEFYDWIIEHAKDGNDDDGGDDGGDDDGNNDDDGKGGGANALTSLKFTAVVLISMCLSYIFQ